MADKEYSYLVFIDETGFMLAPVLRRTWAPRGKTPVLKVTEPHGRISAIGAMTLQRDSFDFGFHFQLLGDNINFNGNSVAKFVADIRHVLNGPITLIWDQYCIHRAKPLREYLQMNPSIEVEELPPYAPELNPVDYVWSYVKYGRLANYCPHHLAELRQSVTTELTRVAGQPRLLRALFSRTGLSLDD